MARALAQNRRGVQGESFPLVVGERERGATPPLAGFMGIWREGPPLAPVPLEKGHLNGCPADNRGAAHGKHDHVHACSGFLEGVGGQNRPALRQGAQLLVLAGAIGA